MMRTAGLACFEAKQARVASTGAANGCLRKFWLSHAAYEYTTTTAMSQPKSATTP